MPFDRPDSSGTAAFVQGLARRVSDRLTQALLTEDDRRALVAALDGNGRVRLVIRVRPATGGWNQTADAALALPWELLAPESGVYPVRDGRLAVIREAVTDQAPDLPEPSGPLTLAVTIAAPEDRAGFPYEQESFRLLAALTPLGQRAVFSNLGGLNDLVELVADVRATAIHFRGHGLPGGLLFENALGFADEVPVAELQRRLATVLLSPRRAGTFPGLFFLAAPYTAREMAPAGQEPASSAFDEESSAASALHRGGFAQVVGYFGPMSAELTTRLEERFYGSLAQGGSTVNAVELARSALNEPLGAAGERVVYPFGWTQLAVYQRGPDRPLALPGRGTRVPLRFRRMVQVHGLPVLERGFIGRRDLLHEIRRRVHGGQRLLILQGLGGLGKTALASQLLARIFEIKPPDRLILRCQEAEDAADPVLALRGQAEEHGRLHRFRCWDARMKDLRECFLDPVEGFVEVVRALRRDRPRLAIYADNVESLQEGPKTEDARALGAWRPGAEAWWRALERLEAEGDGLIFLTTRYLWSDLGERAWVGIGSMSPADSLRMIDCFPSLARLPREVRTRIAERVDGHPRTVEYLDRLVGWQRRKLGRKRLLDPWRDLIEPVLPEQAEQITADLLLEEIWRRLSEGAKEHATTVSVLRVPASQFVIDRLGKARDELIRSGLLTHFREQSSFGARMNWLDRWGFHFLVRELILRQVRSPRKHKAHLEAGAAYEAWKEHATVRWPDYAEGAHHLLAAGQTERVWPLVRDYALSRRSRAQYDEGLAALQGAIDVGLNEEQMAEALLIAAQLNYIRGEPVAEVEVLLEAACGLASGKRLKGLISSEQGIVLEAQGRYAEAEVLQREALASIEESSEDGPEVSAIVLQRLAIVLLRLGRIAEAEALQKQSLEIKSGTLPFDHVEIISGLHNRAYLLAAQDHLKEAEALFRQILVTEAKTRGETHPSFISSLYQLACVLSKQGRHSEAEALLRRVLVVVTETLGKDHPSYGSALHQLVGELRSLGRFQEAEPWITELLQVRESVQGADHPYLGAAFNLLAGLRIVQGRFAEAEDAQARAWSIHLSALGGQHPDLCLLLRQKAEILLHLGRPFDAETAIREGLAIARAHSDLALTTTASLLHQLGVVLTDQGRYEEAEDSLRQALALAGQLLGTAHEDYGTILQELGSVFTHMGRYEEAEPCLCQAVAIAENSQGKEHPNFATALEQWAGALTFLDRFSEAEEAANRAVGLQEEELGHDHPAVGNALHMLGWVLAESRRFAEAEKPLRRSLALGEAALGKSHPSLCPTLTTLAWVVIGTNGDREEALHLVERALAIGLSHFGEAHPSVALILSQLAQTQAVLGLREAQDTARRASDALLASLGPDHPETRDALPELQEILAPTPG